MAKQTQKLSIRLLREGKSPEDSLRKEVKLSENEKATEIEKTTENMIVSEDKKVRLVRWDKFENAQIAVGAPRGNTPKWANFLDLPPKHKPKLNNRMTYGLVFIQARGRWFAVSFGTGHFKLEPSMFEQNFGLRVVLNSVDPDQLKSADVHTPDENTISRRLQTSRGSDQSVFNFDHDRDIMRGLAGAPKNMDFASRVAGSDALTVDKNMDANDLRKVCLDAYALFQKDDYKEKFEWIDYVRHVREKDLIAKLNDKLVEVIQKAIDTGNSNELHMAFPVIYDPEKLNWMQYKGFRSSSLHSDLDFDGYLEALRDHDVKSYTVDDLQNHGVHEVDDSGKDCGGKWSVSDCLVFETKLDDNTYILSIGRWYQVDGILAKEVEDFFQTIPLISLPKARENENEVKYNQRLANLRMDDLLCLDRKLITSTDARSPIEICDFLGKGERQLIHVKNGRSSASLSHLFNQGMVSARVLNLDGLARDAIRKKIMAAQTDTGQRDFEKLIQPSKAFHDSSEFTVVFAVITSGDRPTLPFFSLVSFRQTARVIMSMRYKIAFCWIEKPESTSKPKPKRKSKPRVKSVKAKKLVSPT